MILTRDVEYRKTPNRFAWFVRRVYRKFPEFVKIMLRRHGIYNEQVQYIREQEERGNVFVIRPQRPLEVGRMEKNNAKLDALYLQGYEDAKRCCPRSRLGSRRGNKRAEGRTAFEWRKTNTRRRSDRAWLTGRPSLEWSCFAIFYLLFASK